MLIDDDADDQEIFCQALESVDQSINCSFANDGVEALEKLNADEAFIPHYIFIDMNMPRMNGRQCLGEIKKIDRLKNVELYMYSTAADPKTIAETKEMGAKEFIVKPSNFNDLTKKLTEIFNDHSPGNNMNG